VAEAGGRQNANSFTANRVALASTKTTTIRSSAGTTIISFCYHFLHNRSVGLATSNNELLGIPFLFSASLLRRRASLHADGVIVVGKTRPVAAAGDDA